MNHNRSLVILTIVHILVGLIIGYYAEDGPPRFLILVYIGLFFAQTSLVGIWGGLATVGCPVRMVGVAVGIGYLLPQMCLSLGDWNRILVSLVVLPTLVVTVVMLVVRRCLARLDRTVVATISENTEGLQFTIRHLLLLTLVVSLILALGRWLQPYFPHSKDLAVVLIVSLCFVSVGVTSVWAMLGRTHIVLRSCVVLFIGAAAACIPPSSLVRGSWGLGPWITLMTVQVFVLLASLFVVRRCGFRLVRVSSKAHTADDKVTAKHKESTDG
jgi:hypothetical protein